ncbi:MAG: hypothetical protein R3F60_28630 [bacterium]
MVRAPLGDLATAHLTGLAQRWPDRPPPLDLLRDLRALIAGLPAAERARLAPALARWAHVGT